MTDKQHMNIVVAGHVDHGKSTVIGRLLADTHSLPDGKIEQIREMCRRNSKPFEYAFLLDALKDERSQGITIDTARCFFETEKRKYIIIDAPGHIEFLKNMITGASRAQAALLVIDAAEGNELIGMAIVSVPAYPEATALQLVAERQEDHEMDETVKKLAETEARLKLAEEKMMDDEEKLRQKLDIIIPHPPTKGQANTFCRK